MKWGPSVYSVKTSSAFSSMSSFFIQSSAYFFRPSSLGVMTALVGQVARLDLPHALFDFFEIFGGEGVGAVEVVVEAVVDGRTDAELGFGEQLQHGGGEQVRSRSSR